MLPGLALTLLLSPPPAEPGVFSSLPPDPEAYRRRSQGFAAGIGISCVLLAAGVGMMIGGSLMGDADEPALLYAGAGLAPAAVVPLVVFSVLYARNERKRAKAQATLVPGGFVLRF